MRLRVEIKRLFLNQIAETVSLLVRLRVEMEPGVKLYRNLQVSLLVRLRVEIFTGTRQECVDYCQPPREAAS